MSRRYIFLWIACIIGGLLLAGTALALAAIADAPLPISPSDWYQANQNGFGDPANLSIISLEAFDGQIYAATNNMIDHGQLWRTADGITWTQVISSGFWDTPTDTLAAPLDMIGFHAQLYLGVTDLGTGQIWRSPNGMTWTQVEGAGFENLNNLGINTFAVYKDWLYAATINMTEGIEIWRSSSGEPDEWSKVLANGHGNANNVIVNGFIEYRGYLYAMVENWGVEGDEIWRTPDGENWEAVVTDAFGATDTDNYGLSGPSVFGSYLYVGTSNAITGGQVYRTQDGLTWTKVVGDGFGDMNNGKVESLIHFEGLLCAATGNETTGIEVWCSANGLAWEQVNLDGFGDANNMGTMWSIGSLVYDHGLYIGMVNKAEGGEVWMVEHYRDFIPLVRKP
ncbi:MAG: hypothetical protein A2W36_04510 [Chloroflexi bacterium RBG_16_58_14]|nr:MAG: hypothetical protein A2W36_04510 [Chloroflexi bacterium RBG_16_58_14]